MKKILCGGCFNRLHPGHVYFLTKAKSHGDHLIVVLAHDDNNRKKNAIPAEQRKINLQKLGIADKIIIGDPNDPEKVIREERPDIIALGYDQKLPVKTSVKVVHIEKHGDYSSSKLSQS